MRGVKWKMDRRCHGYIVSALIIGIECLRFCGHFLDFFAS